MPNLVAINASLTTALDRPADQFFVGVRAIHVGRVEQSDASVQRMVDGGDRFGIVAAAIELAHAHAAEAKRGNPGTIRAEAARLHVLLREQWCRSTACATTDLMPFSVT